LLRKKYRGDFNKSKSRIDKEILKTIEHRETTIRAKAERAYLKEIGGGCHLPVGAYTEILGE